MSVCLRRRVSRRSRATAASQIEAFIYTIDPNMLYGAPVTTIGRYNRQGTLFVNLIDRRTKKSAWIGMVTDSLPTGILSPEQIRAQLDKAAKNIFKKYPIRRGSSQ